MKKSRIKKFISFIFAKEENFTLEKRILLSSIILGLVINIFAAVVNSILTTSIIAIIIPLILAIVVFILYYFVRFGQVGEILPTVTVIISIIGVAAIWVFNGGINGGNIMPAFVVLILGLIVVPYRFKKNIITLFICINVFILLIQYFRPEFIVPYQSETDRWIDTLISLIYSSYFIYLIINFFHKNYTLEKQRAEENEKKFRILYDNSPDMYLSVSAKDATILRCNQRLLDNLGYSRDEIIGRSIFKLSEVSNENRNADIYKNSFAQFLESGIIKNTELILTRKDGSKLHVSLNSEAIRDENNIILYSITSLRDITEQKKAELIIVEQNKELSKLNADKDRFMTILAHDLKSPFNSLLGFSDMLLKKLNMYDKDKIEQQLSIINKISHQTYNLLEDLLLWSKSQSGKLPFEPKKIDFIELCAEIVKNLSYHAGSKKISINFFKSDETRLTADYNMIKTILRNLLSNAIKFTDENGQISIFSKTNESYILITVSDSGIGIGKENQEKLWDFSQPYSTDGTRGEKGTGLGLLLCKEFVERHGGKIWVESELGNGCAFKFSIPFIDAMN